MLRTPERGATFYEIYHPEPVRLGPGSHGPREPARHPHEVRL